jgi:hypothetical protein
MKTYFYLDNIVPDWDTMKEEGVYSNPKIGWNERVLNGEVYATVLEGGRLYQNDARYCKRNELVPVTTKLSDSLIHRFTKNNETEEETLEWMYPDVEYSLLGRKYELRVKSFRIVFQTDEENERYKDEVKSGLHHITFGDEKSRMRNQLVNEIYDLKNNYIRTITGYIPKLEELKSLDFAVETNEIISGQLETLIKRSHRKVQGS